MAKVYENGIVRLNGKTNGSSVHGCTFKLQDKSLYIYVLWKDKSVRLNGKTKVYVNGKTFKMARQKCTFKWQDKSERTSKWQDKSIRLNGKTIVYKWQD